MAHMSASGVPVRLRLDDKRRTTLPPALLAAAGVGPGADLVARVEAPGRIVLESPAAILAGLQAAVRQGAPTRGHTRSLVEELLAERAVEAARELAEPRESGEAAEPMPTGASVEPDEVAEADEPALPDNGSAEHPMEVSSTSSATSGTVLAAPTGAAPAGVRSARPQ